MAFSIGSPIFSVVLLIISGKYSHILYMPSAVLYFTWIVSIYYQMFVDTSLYRFLIAPITHSGKSALKNMCLTPYTIPSTIVDSANWFRVSLQYQCIVISYTVSPFNHSQCQPNCSVSVCMIFYLYILSLHMPSNSQPLSTPFLIFLACMTASTYAQGSLISDV